MISVAFSISCMLFLIILSIVYFSKKRLNNIDNKIFTILIVVSLIGTIMDVIGYFSFQAFGTEFFLNKLISKLYLIYYLVYTFFLTVYVANLSFHKIEEKLSYFIWGVIGLSILVSCLPIQVHMEENIAYSHGPAVSLCYMFGGIFVIVMVASLLKGRKRIKSKEYAPIFLFIFLTVITMTVQQINPAITLLLLSNSVVTFLMYFTIENPDMRMIEQLNIAKGQAEKANAAKTDFLSNMSHEIRTPLNAIVGFSQSLGENDDLSDEVKDQVKDILAASDNLLEIVNGVLDISKIEANKLEIVNKEYSFKKVFQELVILTKSRIGEKPIELRTSMDPTIPPVLYGDYVRLKQIILNLLTNAAKYTKEGYIELKVSSVQKDGICRLIISVEDTGIGIAKEKIDKLFTKFERFDLEENITIEGTGLGLAITKKLVELMNGRIVVQSDYGFGSKFTVAIDQKIMEGVVLEDSKTGITPQVGNIVGKKVLVVDDNALNLKVASMLLKKYSLMVETVSSGFECIEKWKRGERYDLILMDDMMPKMSGSETLKHLKEDPSFQTPVVALTANAISGMREKYLSDGFDDYLAKPIDRTELDRVLEHYLKK